MTTLHLCSTLSLRRWSRLMACAAILATLSLVGCEEKSREPTSANTTTEQPLGAIDPAMDAATQALWSLGTERLDASVAAAEGLRQSIRDFLDQPTAESLDTVRQAWHFAHDAYLGFEIFTFVGRSNPGLFGRLSKMNFAVHAWPITPGYIDYFSVYVNSGIVNDIAMPLTAEELRRQHGFSDDTDVSLGFHAIAYLLWGENRQRPVDDYLTQATPNSEQLASGIRPVDLPNNRRRVLLGLLAELLVDDLNLLKNYWLSDTDGPHRNYLLLHPQSRVQLLHAAAMDYLATLEQRYLSANSNNEDDDAEIVTLQQHNGIAGRRYNAMGLSVANLQQLIVSSDGGIGQWLFEEPQRQSLQEALSKLQVQLKTLADQLLSGQVVTDPALEAPVLALARDTFAQLATALSPSTEPEPASESEESGETETPVESADENPA